MKRRDWLIRTGALATGLTTLPAYAAREAFERHLGIESLDKAIRLHSNENPLGPSASARLAMSEAFDLGCLYPSEHYGSLVTRIAEREGVDVESVILGAGSHEILRLVATNAAQGGGRVIIPDPTFESVAYYTKAAGGTVTRVPLTSSMDTDVSGMMDRVGPETRMLFVCNPNNPTGRIVPIADIRAMRARLDDSVLLFVDEAYHEYVEDVSYESAVPIIKEGGNVVVSRTFSKVYGLAGMRVGYGIAAPELARALRNLRARHPLSIVSVAAATASYDDLEFVTRSRVENSNGRDLVYSALSKHGRRFLPSQSNFVFFHVGIPVGNFATRMLEEGIRVGRPFPPYETWCRLSIGTLDQMRHFADAFDRIAPELPKS